MDGHLDNFQNFRNKNKDAKKTIELRPLGDLCAYFCGIDIIRGTAGWKHCCDTLLNWPWKTCGPSAQRK